MPKARKVEALSLLDDNSNLYFAIPNSVDDELLEKILKERVSGITEKEIERIMSRINTVYAGIDISKKIFSTDAIQIAVDGNIPKKMVPKLLNKKNGWEVITCNSECAKKYPIYTKQIIQGSDEYINLAFPSNNVACAGRDIESMLSRYDTFSSPDFLVELQPELQENESIMLKDEYFYNYLRESNDEIRFFTNNPNTFLASLIGINVDLKIVTVAGAIVKDDEEADKYKIKLMFKFSSNKFLKAGRAILKLAFGFSNKEVEEGEDSELIVQNVHISKEQIYKLLSL